MKLVALGLVAAVFLAASGSAADVAGSSTGVFVNPQPSGAVTTGVGTSTFTFGDNTGFGSPPNQLTFAGSAFSSSFETPFKIGTLTYFNGTVAFGTEVTSVDLSLSTVFTTPTIPTVSNAFTLSVVTTPNTGDPNADADYLNLPTSFGASDFVIGGTTYHVALTGFGNVVGDGFLASNATQLHVREGASATADLFAEVTSRTSAAPEPASWALMLIGFGGIGTAIRRGRRIGVSFG